MKCSIILVNSRNILHKAGGALIKAVEGTNFSHVAVQVELKGTRYIYHAVFPKSKRDPVATFRQDYEIYKKYDFNIEYDELLVYNYMQILIGRPYSVAQLLLILIGRIGRIVSKVTFGWILNHDQHLICSELVGIFMTVFLKVDFDKSTDNIDLIDIEKACDNLSKK